MGPGVGAGRVVDPEGVGAGGVDEPVGEPVDDPEVVGVRRRWCLNVVVVRVRSPRTRR